MDRLTDQASLRKIHEAILDTEVELDLFQVRVQGAPIWENVRRNAMKQALHDAGLTETPPPRETSTLFGRIAREMRALRFSATHNPFWAGEHDRVFLGHPRRKLNDDGRYEDIYTDPLLKACDRRALVLEGGLRHQHRRPTETGSIRYLDALRIESGLRRRIIGPTELTKDAAGTLALAEDRIGARTGADIDLRRPANRYLRPHQALLQTWRRLLKKLGPELLVLVGSYGSERPIQVCQELGIVTAELQHGLISPLHLGYAYPGSRDKARAPDHILLWGDFWKGAADYPVPSENLHSAGFPYFDRERRRWVDAFSEDRILFVSQPTIGRSLADMAIETEDLAEDVDVAFKLHPGEVSRWRDRYEELVGSDVQVFTDERPFYRLLAESRLVVGVSSTGLYEALGMGTPVCVANLPGKAHMEPLLDQDRASLVEGSGDILNVWQRIQEGRGSEAIEPSSFFRPGAQERIPKILDGLTD